MERIKIHNEIEQTYRKSDRQFLNVVKRNLSNPAFMSRLNEKYPYKRTNIQLIDFGIKIINILNKKYPRELLTAYIVGSVGGGYCTNKNQERILVDSIGKREHELDYAVVKKTPKMPSDLDLEVIFSDPAVVDVAKLKDLIQKIQTESHYDCFPVDLRIISKKDTSWYLSTVNNWPNYLFFRLLLATPLCIFGKSVFDKLQKKALKAIVNREKHRHSPEFRRWLAFQNEKILIKELGTTSELKLMKDKLVELDDLLWYFAIRVSDPQGRPNVSTFPMNSASTSIKLKFGFS